jgi:hypothetical protein
MATATRAVRIRSAASTAGSDTDGRRAARNTTRATMASEAATPASTSQPGGADSVADSLSGTAAAYRFAQDSARSASTASPAASTARTAVTAIAHPGTRSRPRRRSSEATRTPLTGRRVATSSAISIAATSCRKMLALNHRSSVWDRDNAVSDGTIAKSTT